MFFVSSTSNANDQLYYRIGFFDYKHETGGLMFNIKKVTENKYNIITLGELTQIHEFTSIIDNQNLFSKGKSKKEKQEYSIYLSSGLQKVISLTDNFSVVPSFSVGLFHSIEKGKEMGFPIEFKSEVELYYDLSQDSYLGLSWNHISNADIGDKNPGADSILFSITTNF
tara:strand:+ start:300 stop:806 length:507 start_codon:yes stop_codon:yes gene_type:complete